MDKLMHAQKTWNREDGINAAIRYERQLARRRRRRHEERKNNMLMLCVLVLVIVGCFLA